jgi:sulfotransferase famil protein
MELSRSHRFIFVHVYRSGGQSVTAALEPYLTRPRLARIPLLRRLGDRRLEALRTHNHGHISARELRTALPREQFDSFFTFGFVRNPWSWQVSVFHFVRQRVEHPDHEFFKVFRDFDHYLDWRVNTAGPELQSDFVCDASGELLVDFLGHYETLAVDFAQVCARLGISRALPHKNRSQHHNYREYYSADTRGLVAEAYRADIERFGYEFEGQKPLAPIVPFREQR